MDKEELKKEIKELKERLDKLETKRIFQMDIMPQSVKFRHLDWVEIGQLGLILYDTATGTKYRLKVTSGVLGIEAV